MRDHELVLTVPLPDAAVATTVERALALDAGAIEGARSEANVSREGDAVVVTIEADDPSALRAAKRTWFSLVRVAEAIALDARAG